MALPRDSGRSRTVNFSLIGKDSIRNGDYYYSSPSFYSFFDRAKSGAFMWYAGGGVYYAGALPTISLVSVSGMPNGFQALGSVFTITATVRFTRWDGTSFDVSASTDYTVPYTPGATYASVATSSGIQSAEVVEETTGTADLTERLLSGFARDERLDAYEFSSRLTSSQVVARVTLAGNTVLFVPFLERVDIPIPNQDATAAPMSGTPGITAGYRWLHYLSARRDVDSITALPELSLSGSGLQAEGVALSGSGSGWSLGGTTAEPALTRSSAGTTTVAVCGEPDWAWQGAGEFRDYDGELVTPFPDTVHLCGSEEIGTGAGSHRYPSAGYTAYGSWEEPYSSDPNSAFKDWENYRTFGRCGTVPSNLNAANAVQIDPDWANANGIMFDGAYGGQNSKWLAFRRTPRFTGGTIQIAASHAFNLFEALSNWDASPYLAFGTVLTFANPDATTRPIVADYILRPWAYRYYRFQVRSSEPGATLTLVMQRETSRASTPSEIPTYGPVRYFIAEYRWNFTVAEKDAWEEKEFDLCFPDTLVDGASFDERYVLHPERFLQKNGVFFASDGVYSLEVEFHSAATYELDAFTGYHESSGTRSPVRLHSFYALNGALPEGDGSVLQARESGAAGAGSPSTPEESPIYGRVLINGARGFPVGQLSGTPTVKAAWTAIQTLFDTAAKDTGITITPNPDTTYPEETDYRQTAQPDTALLRVITSAYGVPHAHRSGYSFGYYGMGDPVGTGEYGVTVVNRAEKWLTGSVSGMLWKDLRSSRGCVVQLRQHPDAALLGLDTTDYDGFYSIAAPYGVVRPYTNDPGSVAQFTESGGEVVSYTPQGNLLSFHWLRSTSFVDKDADHYALIGGERPTIAVQERFPSWWDLIANPAGGLWPTCIHNRWAAYLRANASTGGVRAFGADQIKPAFQRNNKSVTVVATDLHPALAHDEHGSADVLLFSRDDNVYETLSHDDGTTWGAATLVLAGGKYPRILIDEIGNRLIAAYVGGVIQGRSRSPGESVYGATFTFATASGNLSVDDDAFDLSQSPDGAMRYILVCVRSGSIEEYESVDEGRTWRLVTA